MTDKQYHEQCDRVGRRLQARLAYVWRFRNWFVTRYACYEYGEHYVRYVRAYSKALLDGR